MGRGTVTEEVELMLFDAIFHLPSRAVIIRVQFTWTELFTGKGGDDKMPSCPVAIVGEFAHHPPLTTPGVQGLVGE